MPPSLTPCRPSSTGQRTEGFRRLTRLSIRGRGHHKTLRSWETIPGGRPGEKQPERCEGYGAQDRGLRQQPPQLCCSQHEFSAELPGLGGKSRGGSRCCTRSELHRGKRGPPPTHLGQPPQGPRTILRPSLWSANSDLCQQKGQTLGLPTPVPTLAQQIHCGQAILLNDSNYL